MPHERLKPTFTLDEERMAELKRVVPEAFADGKVNWDALREALGENLEEEGKEHYVFTWPGKRAAKKIAAKSPQGTLIPAKGEGVDEETTNNIFIEGDNLEVLKLLQKSYSGRIKMIYIDPPYNTGNDFIYKDNYAQPLDEYLKITGQTDTEGVAQTTNKRADGRFHTNWLNMIYPRLKLARNLLREDGVIFISIDDNEVDNLRKSCDEIFGEENRVAIICHKARASVSNDKIISSSHNFILLYARNGGLLFDNRSRFGLAPDLTGFDKTDAKGAFKYAPVDGPGGGAKGNPHYTFLGVTGYFRFSKERMQKMYDEGLIEKVGSGLQQKYYLEEAKNSRKTDTTWWDEKFYTATASSRLKDLMGADAFDNPKPVELIQKMLELWVRDESDIVLDFFAGSGTTGHAVMIQNCSDSVNRRFILVQLPEQLDPENKDQKIAADYCDKLGKPRTIAEVTKERLRRVALKAREGNSLFAGDLGFKVLKYARSNFKVWNDYKEQNVLELQAHMETFQDPLVKGWKKDNLFVEMMLQKGFPLDSKIAKISKFKSNAVREVSSSFCGHKLFVCLDEKIEKVTIADLSLNEKDVFVCLDSALTDEQKVRLSDKGFLTTI